MYNPTTRLLTILELLQSREQLSASELAKKLEVEERSIRRYITMLRDIGIPIDSERGRYGGYTLRPGFRLPPMMFNHDEIVAVIVGLMIMRELGTLSLMAVESATAKIERVLPDELRLKSRALQQFLTFDLMPTYAVSSEWLLMLNLAALDKLCIDLTYTSALNEMTQRVVSIYGVVLHGQTWYIVAHCHLRDALRVFRLDRVQSLSYSDQPYHYSQEIDVKGFVINSLARTSGVYVFKVLFHASLETVSAYIPQSMAILEDYSGETLMCCYSDDPHWLARYLASIEIPFTVQETDELCNALRLLASRLLESCVEHASKPTLD